MFAKLSSLYNISIPVIAIVAQIMVIRALMCVHACVCVCLCACVHRYVYIFFTLPLYSIPLSSLICHRGRALCIESKLLHGEMCYERELKLQVIRLQWLFCQALGKNANY